MKETNSDKTAIVFGATGLVGKVLLQKLCTTEIYTRIKSIGRRSTGLTYPKLTEVINPLTDPEEIREELSGDVVFCCLGTTIKKAGSKEAFRKTDLELPVKLAAIARENQVKKFIIISSIGADAKSGNFYLRTKGEMEKQLLEINIPDIIIVRPSMLLGKRDEFRFGEALGKVVMKVLSPVMMGKLKKYRGIKAETVASAMINLANSNEDQKIVKSDELEEWGKE